MQLTLQKRQKSRICAIELFDSDIRSAGFKNIPIIATQFVCPKESLQYSLREYSGYSLSFSFATYHPASTSLLTTNQVTTQPLKIH
jgi:hypothetical protein